MARFVVEGGTPLHGEITPAGNKNEALPLIAASLLTDDPVTLHNVPRIRDVRGMLEIATARGALYPFGKHQERAINFVPLLARYGLALRDDMRTEADRHAAQLVGADAVSETSPEAVAVRGQS